MVFSAKHENGYRQIGVSYGARKCRCDAASEAAGDYRAKRGFFGLIIRIFSRPLRRRIRWLKFGGMMEET